MRAQRTAAQLVSELYHNAKVSGNRPLERRLADTTAWYYNNAYFLPKENLQARVEMLHRAFWIMLEINALLLQRLHEQEGSKDLWLPAGLDINGELRSFR